MFVEETRIPDCSQISCRRGASRTPCIHVLNAYWTGTIRKSRLIRKTYQTDTHIHIKLHSDWSGLSCKKREGVRQATKASQGRDVNVPGRRAVAGVLAYVKKIKLTPRRRDVSLCRDPTSSVAAKHRSPLSVTPYGSMHFHSRLSKNAIRPPTRSWTIVGEETIRKSRERDMRVEFVRSSESSLTNRPRASRSWENSNKIVTNRNAPTTIRSVAHYRQAGYRRNTSIVDAHRTVCTICMYDHCINTAEGGTSSLYWPRRRRTTHYRQIPPDSSLTLFPSLTCPHPAAIATGATVATADVTHNNRGILTCTSQGRDMVCGYWAMGKGVFTC